MSYIVENLWDCQYCGTKGNRGRDYICPNCGKTRDESVKFYLPDEITEYKKPIEQGPDWYCPYCNSYNRHSVNNCKCCGAERGSKTYFDFQKPQEKFENYTASENLEDEDEFIEPTFIEQEYTPRQHTPVKINIPQTYKIYEPPKPQVEKKSKRKFHFTWKRAAAVLILLALIITGIAAIPRYKNITVSALDWQREIDIETNTLVQEDDWSVPADAVEVLYTRQEIHHYNKVLDHYKTVTETKSRQVQDGYDVSYTYRDLGNGFSERVEHRTPRYRTEYYTETHEEPVYRDEPVYRTKYYYTVWRYIYSYTVTSSGDDTIEPYWGSYTFVGDQREGGRREKYSVTYLNKKDKEKTAIANSQEIWEQMEVGNKYQVKMSLNYIIEVKGEG